MRNRQITSAHVRRVITRGIVTTTALAAVASVVAPGVAVAKPANAVAETSGIGTTDTQRVEAAAVVRLDPSPDVLLLSDYDFIHTLWQKAKDAGEKLGSVRTAAEEAMASTSAESHVRFITTGIHQAHKLDQQREKDKADAERAATLAKSQALLALGIPSTPTLLSLSEDNFIREIARHSVSGPEVRGAAVRALAGDAAAWREFIVNGAREAHQRDVANELKDLEEKNRREAERRQELAARANAAALFRLTPSEAMLSLSDDNFIRELLRIAPEDTRNTELYAAAQRAALSSSPADWKAFIHTGADLAYKRDDAARRKKVAEANRRLALQIQAAAENGRVNPGLVAAAKEALAGSDEDVAEFLKEDNQYRARRQSFQPADAKLAGWYIRQSSADEGEIFLAPVDSRSKQFDREDATWVIVPALANQPGCHSFESVRKPGYYLKVDRDRGRARISPDDRSAKFRESATWCADGGFGGSGMSFRWGGDDLFWLQRKNGDLYGGLPARPGSNEKREWVDWKISDPLAR
ncbi:AbfB domain-containing protein [Streptomyces netropsis]|uniref:AbfB domain-containing protein n=1 Tax=Streptomyces netropsis TaxID=55404 RepID=UPI0030CD5F2A